MQNTTSNQPLGKSWIIPNSPAARELHSWCFKLLVFILKGSPAPHQDLLPFLLFLGEVMAVLRGQS